MGFEGENYQKIQIVEAVKEFVPGLSVDITEKGKDLRDYQVDFSKMKEHLNLVNRYTVRDGVQEVITMLEGGYIQDTQAHVYSNHFPDLGEDIENKAEAGVGCS